MDRGRCDLWRSCGVRGVTGQRCPIRKRGENVVVLLSSAPGLSPLPTTDQSTTPRLAFCDGQQGLPARHIADDVGRVAWLWAWFPCWREANHPRSPRIAAIRCPGCVTSREWNSFSYFGSDCLLKDLAVSTQHAVKLPWKPKGS
jgi:hypothetical protein